jgi:hypothetical protein
MEENAKAAQYYVDVEGAAQSNRSASVLIAARKCHTCRQGDTEETIVTSDPQEHAARIVEHCMHTADYLLPDTPLKEAIFKIILASGNEPKTAEEISEELAARWAMGNYPRNHSAEVIGRILEHSKSYCITSVREPEPEGSDGEAEASSEA